MRGARAGVGAPRGQEPGRVFVTWMSLFRARALARAVDAELYEPSGGSTSWPAPLRYALQVPQTVARVVRDRPRDVIFTNPPFVSGLVLVAVGRLLGARVWSDTHSGAFNDPKWARFARANGFVLRRCHGVIVHTAAYSPTVIEQGGRPLVVSNPATEAKVRAPVPEPRLVATVGYGFDEPIRELLEAARQAPDVTLTFTGRAPDWVRAAAPANCTFTGWLSRADYEELLSRARGVVCLTLREDTMQRGAHEALQFALPMLLSGTRVLRAYFPRGAVFVGEHDPATLSRGLRTLWDEHERLGVEAQAGRAETLQRCRREVEELREAMAA